MQVNSAYFLCLFKGGLTVSLPLTDSVPKEVVDKSVKQIAIKRAIQQQQFLKYLDTLCVPFMIFLSYMPYSGKMPEDGKNNISEEGRGVL
jgi:short subunit fatty acids transporter